MNPHFFTALFTLLSFGLGFKVQGSEGSKGSRGWCDAFRHPERRKRSCVKKWLI